MADNKPQSIVTPKGRAVWPHLNTPDTKFNAEGEYTTKLSIPADEAQGLVKQLEAIRDSFFEDLKEKDPKVARYNMADVFEEEMDDQGNTTGNYIFKFKQKALITTRAGKTYEPKIAIVDSKRAPTDAVISGGSVIKISATVLPYAMPTSKTVGVSLRPAAVQIIELASGGGAAAAASAFDIEDGYTGSAASVAFSDDEDGDDF